MKKTIITTLLALVAKDITSTMMTVGPTINAVTQNRVSEKEVL